MKYFAVFGKPVLHSKSPQIFNYGFYNAGFNYFYTRVLVDTGAQVVKTIRDLNLSGSNITSPFKEAVLPHLDELSGEAKNIGAVNTIINHNGFLTGYNTDPFGVIGALSEKVAELNNKKCIVFGAGGAGKAATYGLINSGADVTLTNRTILKARDIAQRYGCEYLDINDAVANINSFDIAVMALLPGIWPLKNENIKPGLVLLDAIYGQKQKNNNNIFTFIDGHRWLLYHAAECFRYFTGHKAKINILEKGLKQNLNPESVNIKFIRHDVYELLSNKQVDLLLYSDNISNENIKQIIDDEKNHAFGY